MAESTIKKQGLKSATFSGTTDVGGDVFLGINLSSGKIVVQAVVDNQSYVVIPKATGNGNWYATCEKYVSGAWVIASNVDVSGTYYYFDS